MKKIVFATQVVGLIAMFPILVMLEMNHPAGTAPANNVPSPVVKKTVETSFRLPEKVKVELVNEVFPITLKVLL